jgi:hypothetical protein
MKQLVRYLLISLFVLYGLALFAQTPVTINGTIQDAGGNLATSGTVVFSIQPQSSGIQYYVPGVTAVVPQAVTCVIDNLGTLQNASQSGACKVWGNDVIAPANTTYTVTFSPNGQQTNSVAQQCVLGVGPYNISTPQFCPVVSILPQYSSITAPVIQGNIIPKFNGTFTLGNAQGFYANAFLNNLTLAPSYNGCLLATNGAVTTTTCGGGGPPTVTSNLGVGANNASTIAPVSEVNYLTTLGNTAFACQEDHNKGDWDVRCIRSGTSWASNPSQALINTIHDGMCYHFVNGGPIPTVHIPSGSFSIGGNISLPPAMDLEGDPGSQYGFATLLITNDSTQAMFTHVGSQTFNCGGTNYTISAGMSSIGNVTLHGGGSANANDIGLLNGTGGSTFEYLHNMAFQFFGGPGRTDLGGANGQNSRGSNIWANSNLQWYLNSGAYNVGGFTDPNPHCQLELGDVDSRWDHLEVTLALPDSGYYNRFLLNNVCLGGGGQGSQLTDSYLQLAPHNVWMYNTANSGQRVLNNRLDGSWWDSIHVLGSPGTFSNNTIVGKCISPTLNPANFGSNPGGVSTDLNCAGIEVYQTALGSVVSHNWVSPGGLWAEWPVYGVFTSNNVFGGVPTKVEQPVSIMNGLTVGGLIGYNSFANPGSDVSQSMFDMTQMVINNVGGTLHFNYMKHANLNDSVATSYNSFDGLYPDTYVTINIGPNDTIQTSSTIHTCLGGNLTNVGWTWWWYVNGFGLTQSCSPENSPADNEVPAGVIDGTNATFTLANSPNPASSLHLYRNGLRQVSPTDYTITGNTITYQNPPSLGDTHVADYTY